MSLVSTLPFGDSLAYWWRATNCERARPRFMALKLLEVSAFWGNWWQRRQDALPHSCQSIDLPHDRGPNEVPDDPRVVVVVPAYCRTAADLHRLDALLAGLARQSRPCVPLLVDDGSPSWTPRPATEVLRCGRNLGPATARNRGRGASA